LLNHNPFRYNVEMMKKKISTLTFNTCFVLLTIIIVSGCSTPEKKINLVEIQRSRIQILQNELEKKEQLISELKAKDWMRRPVLVDERIALKKLSFLVHEKKWAQALKESSRLKKDYSHSVALRTFRYKIFQRLGLEGKAMEERSAIQNIIAQSRNSRKASQVQ